MSFTTRPLLTIMVLAALVLAGCGTFATPVTSVQPTREPVTLPPAVIDALNQGPAAVAPAVAAMPTEVPAAIPPTEVPPTVTPLPPTATATATATPLPPTEIPAAAGDAEAGALLFVNGKDIAPACVTCHLINQDAVLIGPSMIGIAARAATRVEGQNAAEYLRASILEPNAFLVPNTDTNVFSAGGTSLMFQQYADYLTEAEVDDLVAYMLTFE